MSGPLPGAVQDLSAARIWGIIRELADAGLIAHEPAGAFQPSFPILTLYVAGYFWLSDARAMPAGVPGGMGPAAEKPVFALGRNDAQVPGCPTLGTSVG